MSLHLHVEPMFVNVENLIIFHTHTHTQILYFIKIRGMQLLTHIPYYIEAPSIYEMIHIRHIILYNIVWEIIYV